MLSYILRFFGMDIPEGPIVFVDNTSILPTTIYDVDQEENLEGNGEERIMVDVMRGELENSCRNRGKNLDGLILSQSV